MQVVHGTTGESHNLLRAFSYHFAVACEVKTGTMRLVKRYWEIVADNLNERWSWGCVSAITSEGRIIWVADAHKDDGKRFVVHAEDKFTAFLELEWATRMHPASERSKS